MKQLSAILTALLAATPVLCSADSVKNSIGMVLVFMGVTEVTVAQYRQFDPRFKTSDAKSRPADDDAASGISWHEAVEFCAWLSRREGKT